MKDWALSVTEAAAADAGDDDDDDDDDNNNNNNNNNNIKIISFWDRPGVASDRTQVQSCLYWVV